MSKSTLDMSHQEWLEDRKRGIGGSDVATVLGLNKYKSPYQLWLEKTGQIELKDSESEPAYWGNVLEEVVAKEFQERTGKKVRRRNQVFEHPLHPFLRANIDRDVVGENAILECKTANQFFSKEWEGEEVPLSYLCQVQHYMNVLNKDTEQMYNESLKARAINFFKGGSVVPNKALFDCTLQNYQIVDQETRQAVEVTKRFVNSVLLGNPSHLVLTGKQGTGKSHLAMAAAWEVLRRSNYDKKILFIGLQEMLDQIKFSYNNPELRKTIEGSLIADIKTADLVVIDDIGSELGKDTSDSRAFGINTLNSFLDARQNLATIITTNLLGEELKKAYGMRTTSRIFVNSDGFTMVFSQTTDKRLKPVKGATA
ncbi:lambda-exonuclease family protein [Enterococcus hirae]